MAKSLHEDWILIPLNSFQTQAQKRCTAAELQLQRRKSAHP